MGPSCSHPRSRLAGWIWGGGSTLCPRFILSPGGETHFPWVEVCIDTGLGLILEQKLQWAEIAATRACQSLRPWVRLLVIVITELNKGP